MKHFRILLPVLILALLLSGCGNTVREPYDYTINNRTLTVYPESGTIVDGLDVYRYTRTENHNGSIDYVITYPNGGRYNWTETQNGGYGGWSEGHDSVLYLSGPSLISALEAGAPRQRVGNVGMGLLLIVLGAANFFLPELPFHLRYGWAVKDAEPSDAYLIWGRISGVIVAIVGLVWCFI